MASVIWQKWSIYNSFREESGEIKRTTIHLSRNRPPAYSRGCNNVVELWRIEDASILRCSEEAA